ncbi:MAG: hypothetical protein ACI9YL_000737 [Luteibaculaceae bacterium]|jgi:hypothetical protein
MKQFLSALFAGRIHRRMNRWKQNPIAAQKNTFAHLIHKGKNTVFGKDHLFSEIHSYADFKARVPARDYEELKPWLDRVANGEADITWPGIAEILCKTSGTTSGAKFIPLTKDSIPTHINGARDALLNYIKVSGKKGFVNRKMIFLQGSPKLESGKGVPYGRLSGIVANFVPKYLQTNRVPSYTVNCIEDWESKLDAVIEETGPLDMGLISGIPSWVQMYFERLLEKTGKNTVLDVFPNFELFVYGGVNFEPYRSRFNRLIGKEIPSLELYPASEGFIAFQDSWSEPGLLLNLAAGVFYEFIPCSELDDENPSRLSLEEVKLGVNYAIILNTNAGLWGYSIGDSIKFVSLFPFRIVVTGRIKHYTSAFGEHVIAEEVEEAMRFAMDETGIEVVEFTVAPQLAPETGLPYHEWLVEFSKNDLKLDSFSRILDQKMQEQNPYYLDLIKGNILQPALVTQLPQKAFVTYMKSEGKLGGQNKIPRLSNNRSLAEKLTALSRKT